MFRWLSLALASVVGCATLVFVYDRTPTSIDRQRLTSTSHPSVAVTTVSKPTTREPPSAKKPRAVVQGDPTFHFGVKPQYTSFTKEWTVQNQGDGELILSLEPPSCACVVAKVPDDVSFAKESKIHVAPARSAPISFRFDTKDSLGKYRWPMAVLTNDPDHPRLEFTAEGTIKTPLIFEPASGVNFGDIFNDEESHRDSIVLYTVDRPKLQITSLKTTRPEFLSVVSAPLSTAECTKLDTPAGYRFEVTLKRGMPFGPFREIVTITNDHPSKPDVGFVVVGKVNHTITVVPDRIRILDASTTSGTERTARLIVRRHRKTKFQVERKPSALEVEILPLDSARDTGAYQLSIHLLPRTSPGVIKDAIILKTDHPAEPEIKIPVEILVNAGS
jgi:hypothetical protein